MAVKAQALAKPDEVAEHLQLPEATLKKWRYLGKGPRYCTVGKYVRYRWSDVEAWLDEQAVGRSA